MSGIVKHAFSSDERLGRSAYVRVIFFLALITSVIFFVLYYFVREHYKVALGRGGIGKLGINWVDVTPPEIFVVGVISAAYLGIYAYVFFRSSVKRFHDLGRSGAYIILLLLPVINIWVFWWLLFAHGQKVNNRFGHRVSESEESLRKVIIFLGLSTLLVIILPAFSLLWLSADLGITLTEFFTSLKPRIEQMHTFEPREVRIPIRWAHMPQLETLTGATTSDNIWATTGYQVDNPDEFDWEKYGQ